MSQRYSKFQKIKASIFGDNIFEGVCPICDQQGRHNDDFSVKRCAKLVGKMTKTSLGALVNFKRTVADQLTSDGIGRIVFCQHCEEVLMVCSKCWAGFRYPTGANERACPNCGAKMMK